MATYTNDRAPDAIVRREPLPVLALAANQSPDPRLPARDWRVRWSGVLETFEPGRYRFSGMVHGDATVRVDGRNVFVSQREADADSTGDEVVLSFGLHEFVVEFVPHDGAARLNLYWESEHFPREPLPAHAVGHLSDDTSSELAQDDPFLRGQLQFEEHSCLACHRPARPLIEGWGSQLRTRPGPSLTRAGERLRAGWIYAWLGDPESFRPEAVMPRLFADDARGAAERYALSVFLAGEGEFSPPAEFVSDEAASAQLQGRALYEGVGCTACHESTPERPARATLQRLGSKTHRAALRDFLFNPAAIDPAGRMPSMQLSLSEAEQLAHYLLVRDKDDGTELPPEPDVALLRGGLLGERPSEAAVASFDAQPREAQWRAWGKELFISQRCALCHELLPSDGGPPPEKKAAAPSLATVVRHGDRGCLAPEGESSAAPRFGKAMDRPLLQRFLLELASANKLKDDPGGDPVAEGRAAWDFQQTIGADYVARIAVARLGCTNCHVWNERGGLAAEQVRMLMAALTESNAEMVTPPALTGVAEKLTSSALRAVIIDGRRARPWMALRMPQFSADVVSDIPQGLAACEGFAAPAEQPPIDVDGELAQRGRELVGTRRFGCLKCHDFLAHYSSGTRGPDLAAVTERVGRAWFDRWMTDPQRIAPGTRMPTVFVGGKSPHTDILEGDPARQREALWHYLLDARNLPPPEEDAAASEDLAATERPTLLRTFLPDVTPRSMAIRGPNGVHLAYDLQACRPAYAWHGEFLDLQPVWADRGGNRAGLKGPIVWRAAPGFPWEVSGGLEEVPDFSGRAADPRYGAELPHDGALHASVVHLLGYHTRSAWPTFRFQWQRDGQTAATIEEQVRTLQSEGAVGISRRIEASTTSAGILWLFAAVADEPPSILGSDGVAQSSKDTIPADAWIRIRREDTTYLLRADSTGANIHWVASRQAGQPALLLAAESDGRQPLTFAVTSWAILVGGDERAVLSDLMKQR